MNVLSGYKKKPEATRRINIWLYPEDEEAIKKIKQVYSKTDSEAIRAALRHTLYDIMEMLDEECGFANSGKDSQGNIGQ